MLSVESAICDCEGYSKMCKTYILLFGGVKPWQT
jgi:hypothetical protein